MVKLKIDNVSSNFHLNCQRCRVNSVMSTVRSASDGSAARPDRAMMSKRLQSPTTKFNFTPLHAGIGMLRRSLGHVPGQPNESCQIRQARNPAIMLKPHLRRSRRSSTCTAVP
ncbi:hypothetical protein VTK56DRAFT_5457 [Thermocarpiscus australiensis]